MKIRRRGGGASRENKCECGLTWNYLPFRIRYLAASGQGIEKENRIAIPRASRLLAERG